MPCVPSCSPQAKKAIACLPARSEARKMDGPSAQQAKQEYEEATVALEAARRALQQAEERHAQAREAYFASDLQRPGCQWNKMYSQLMEHRAQNDGDVLVSTSKDSSDELKKLGKWVQNQRTFYKLFMSGETKHISEHRIEALNRIGFIWNVNDHIWDTNFNALQLHYEQHGTFEVTKKQNYKLNGFVANLRKAMRRRNEGMLQKNNDLTAERVNRLNSINFVWEMKSLKRSAREVPENLQFDYLFELLVDFKKTYGHLMVAKMMVLWRVGDEKPVNEEYKRLQFFSSWMKKEHELFLEGKSSVLDEERVRKLTELGVQLKSAAPDTSEQNGRTKTSKHVGPEIEAELNNE